MAGPETCTREQLDWIAEEVADAGGTAGDVDRASGHEVPGTAAGRGHAAKSRDEQLEEEPA